MPILEIPTLNKGESWSISLHASGADQVHDWIEGPFTVADPLPVVLPVQAYGGTDAGGDGIAITAVVMLSDATTGRPLRHSSAPVLVVHHYGTESESWTTLEELTEAATATRPAEVELDEYGNGFTEEMGARVTTAVAE